MKHSVIIPIYNHQQFIENCIRSVLQQEATADFELIMLDDGSSDRSAEIVRSLLPECRQRCRRVVFESRANKGLSATLNEAVGLAAGDWIHLLASDDYWRPNKLSVQDLAVQEFEAETEIALVFADVDCVDDADNIMVSHRKSDFPTGLTEEAYTIFFHSNPVSAPTTMIRKDALLKVGGFDERLVMEDWDCWLRLSTVGPVLKIDQALAAYRLHETNAHKNLQKMLPAVLRTFAKFIAQHDDLLAPVDMKTNWRKNLKRLYSYARRSNRRLLMPICFDYLYSYFKLPSGQKYLSYAEKVERD